MPELSTIQQIAIWILPVLFAVTLHEAAHAWMANKLGDTTAKALGRLSFNPLKHIDLFGTIIVPLMVLILSNFSFVFGWAKPVPINATLFKNPRRDIALSTAAGPISNLIMAFLWAVILKITLSINPNSMISLFVILTARAGIIVNLLLAYFNLIPIPPLDGSRIVASALPLRWAIRYEKIEPYGFFILLAIMFTGILNWTLTPLINGSLRVISAMLNL